MVELLMQQSTISSATMRHVRRIHFVGIGGVGMSGIAEVLHNLNYQVSGSDLKHSVVLERLSKLGIRAHVGHDAAYVQDADVVVVSTAIDRANPEIQWALAHRIPIVPRAEMLAELMRFRFGIAVAGTHGKTTTTSLTASILAQDGLDPTFVIGGVLNSAGTNARLGAGQYLVAEADESDASFMHLQPCMLVVTNVDKDHMETYGGDVRKLRKTFLNFVHQLPFYGLAIVCVDDPGVQKLIKRISRPLCTYGLSADADVQAVNVRQIGTQMQFDVKFQAEESLLPVTLNLPGKHNVQNALAAIAIAKELGVKDDSIAQALEHFSGIGRRFQVRNFRWSSGECTFVDDYAHHPNELKATIEAARAAWPKRRLMVVFQPHRYTRTRDQFDDFVAVLSDVDELILLEVYAAGEIPITGADSSSLANAIRARKKVVPVVCAKEENLANVIAPLLQSEDLVLMLGAGDIAAMAVQLPHQLGQNL